MFERKRQGIIWNENLKETYKENYLQRRERSNS